MKIYVGNLSYHTTEEYLETAFSAHGTVQSVSVIRDRQTGKSRGFGFVEMDNEEEGSAAIEALNGMQLDGRTLTVNLARPRAESPGRGGGRSSFRGGNRRW